jgi:drug/metabolite transporter (DMT)-like permease
MALFPRLTPPQAAPDTGPARDNLRGAIWLLMDMSLNIWSLSIAKALGLDLPVIQIVFVRALVGLLLTLPFLLRIGALPRLDRPGLQAIRVGLTTIAMSGTFFAVSHLPFALFSTLNFTRPLLMMALAATFLGESIRPRQWLAGGLGLIGVIIAVNPGDLDSPTGLAALGIAVCAGTGAVIILRRLRGEDPLAMILYQTGGLVLITALPALWFWQDPGPNWPLLLMIGVFSQGAQFCFMRAHFWGDAGVLAPLSYISLILSTSVGFFVFAEIPTPTLFIGASLIVAAALLAGYRKAPKP